MPGNDESMKMKLYKKHKIEVAIDSIGKRKQGPNKERIVNYVVKKCGCNSQDTETAIKN